MWHLWLTALQHSTEACNDDDGYKPAYYFTSDVLSLPKLNLKKKWTLSADAQCYIVLENKF